MADLKKVDESSIQKENNIMEQWSEKREGITDETGDKVMDIIKEPVSVDEEPVDGDFALALEKAILIKNVWDILEKIDLSWCNITTEDLGGYETIIIKKKGIDPKHLQLAITVNSGKLMINHTPHQFYGEHHYHAEKDINDTDLKDVLAAVIRDVQTWGTDQQNLERYGFEKISDKVDLSDYWY